MSTDLQPVSPERCEQLLRELVRLRSVVKEDTKAHVWVTARLRELGFTVSQYAIDGSRAPLVLGVLEGDGDAPGIMFDAHFDTVHAVAADWTHDPWGGEVVDGVLYGRGAVDSKGSHVAMLAAIEALVRSGAPRGGPIYFMSDADGEDGFRGAAYMADLKVADRIGTIISAEATSNQRIEIAYPGISAWKITAIGRTAHPTEPEHGINAIVKMGKLVAAVDEGRLALPAGDSRWFAPRVTTNAIRTLPGGGWTIPGRCDAVLSILSPRGTTLDGIRTAIDDFLRTLEREDGEVRFELKLLPMGAGRLWLRPGETNPDHEAVAVFADAVRDVTGAEPVTKEFNGGWVDAVELMRPAGDGFETPAVITFGPGEFDQAHAVDEHIEIAEVARAADIYARAAAALLGATRPAVTGAA